MTIQSRLHGALLGAAVLMSTVVAGAQSLFNEQTISELRYRNVGAFRMGARTSMVAVPTSPALDHLYTFYAGFWTGGLWKTTNNGTTFAPVFDDQRRLGIGAVTVAPSNSNIVWVGTGDAFTSRSSLRGDGVYKSIDAGKNWTNMGLKESHHIAKIVVHPTKPNIVYVAAMGRLFSDNAERGVFRTLDGGKSWDRVLFISEKIGVIDLLMDPRNSSVLYAATYDKQRLPWQMVNGGPESGIYKTTDAGKHWTRLVTGLPAGRIGRIGLDMYQANPDVLYAVIENQNPQDQQCAAAAAATAAAGRAGRAGRAGGGGRPGGPSDPGITSTKGGEVYRTANAGLTWSHVSGCFNVSAKGPYYFSQIFVDPGNDQNLYVTQDGFHHSVNGGKTWDAPKPFPQMFGDMRTLWIDKQNRNRMIMGSDGGIAVSYDGGLTSDAYDNIPVEEIYKVFVDMEEPYNIYAGLQDHEHWKGPSIVPTRGVTINDWVALGGGDGIYVVPDPTDSRWVYTTREYGQHFRLDQKLGYRVSIAPRREPAREGEPAVQPYRFIWEAPIYLSPHNSGIVYAGAQVLLRSVDRGDHWSEISPDLSTNPKDKILPSSEGGVPGGIPWFAISSISESPITAGLIWAGTSDGNVQLTRDGGKTWTNVTPHITLAGGRADAYVSTVSASSHVTGRAYVTKSGYRFDDFQPYAYMTDDFGATWKAITTGLPNEPINVIVEDRKNPNLLFLGNDAGVFVSINRGGGWVNMNNNIPHISVKDMLVHPRDNDLVVGSYARGIWITNIAPLQELSENVLAEAVHVFSIQPTIQRIPWSFGANDYLFGQRHLQTPNDPPGMVIQYYLKNAGNSPANIVITSASGESMARLTGSTKTGINTVVWSTRAGAAGRAGGTGGAGGTDILSQWAPLGEFSVSIEIAGQTYKKVGRITKTMGWSLDGPTAHVIR